jgi:hypothetical protein
MTSKVTRLMTETGMDDPLCQPGLRHPPPDNQ